MAADQLPAHAQAAVTRAAVTLVKAARADLDPDAYILLIRAQLVALHRLWVGEGLNSVDLLAALMAAQGRIGAHLANLADRNQAGQAGRYLDELGGLAAHRTE